MRYPQTLTPKTNLPGESLLENTKKHNLVKTKIAEAPYTKPNIKFNSALRILTSSDGVEPCEYSTGDRYDEYRNLLNWMPRNHQKNPLGFGSIGY